MYFLWVMLDICDLLLMILVEVSKNKQINNYIFSPTKNHIFLVQTEFKLRFCPIVEVFLYAYCYIVAIVRAM